MKEDARFCHRCGNPVEERAIEGRRRPVCLACDVVVYYDPKVVAAVLVPVEGKLLLVQRGAEPGLGQWSFPSGYVDRGEPLEEAAAREVKEETGLDIRVHRLIGLYSRRGDPVILAVYEGEVVGGELAAGGDARDAALWPLGELPRLAFDHDREILEEWRKAGGAGDKSPRSH